MSEYGEVMAFGSPAILDEWGFRKIDGLLEDGTTVIVVSGFILKEVTDSLSLSDAVLRDKILTVSDSVGLADVPLKDWTPQITEDRKSVV